MTKIKGASRPSANIKLIVVSVFLGLGVIAALGFGSYWMLNASQEEAKSTNTGQSETTNTNEGSGDGGGLSEYVETPSLDLLTPEPPDPEVEQAKVETASFIESYTRPLIKECEQGTRRHYLQHRDGRLFQILNYSRSPYGNDVVPGRDTPDYVRGLRLSVSQVIRYSAIREYTQGAWTLHEAYLTVEGMPELIYVEKRVNTPARFVTKREADLTLWNNLVPPDCEYVKRALLAPIREATPEPTPKPMLAVTPLPTQTPEDENIWEDEPGSFKLKATPTPTP